MRNVKRNGTEADTLMIYMSTKRQILIIVISFDNLKPKIHQSQSLGSGQHIVNRVCV